jgi:DNA-binding transcriptional ArsR family regulator
MAMYQSISKSEIAAGELAKPLNITLTATLKHLRVLEEAGLATTVKVGRERRCRVQAQALVELENWIEETRKSWTFRLDNLDAFLREPEINL